MIQAPYRTKEQVTVALDELDPKNLNDGNEIAWALYTLIEVRAALSRGDLDHHLDELTFALERKRVSLTTHSIFRRVLAAQALTALSVLIGGAVVLGQRGITLVLVLTVPATLKTIIDLARHSRRELVAQSITETIALARSRTQMPQLSAPREDVGEGVHSPETKETVRR